jgi:hypothetical protein
VAADHPADLEPKTVDLVEVLREHIFSFVLPQYLCLAELEHQVRAIMVGAGELLVIAATPPEVLLAVVVLVVLVQLQIRAMKAKTEDLVLLIQLQDLLYFMAAVEAAALGLLIPAPPEAVVVAAAAPLVALGEVVMEVYWEPLVVTALQTVVEAVVAA